MSVFQHFPELLAIAVLVAFVVGLIWGYLDRKNNQHVVDSEVFQP